MANNRLTPHDAEALLRRAGVPPKEIRRQLGTPPGEHELLAKAPPRPAKYGNRKTTAKDGTTKHSGAEARWWNTLLMRQAAGEISGLIAQARVTLPGKIGMIVDARYIEDGVTIHHEYKGFATPVWQLQKRVWSILGPTEYRVTYKSGTTDIVRPGLPNSLLLMAARALEIRCGRSYTLGQVVEFLEANNA